MEKKLEITADGSHTITLPSLDEQYHSLNGAVTEAYHVFIRNGLDFFAGSHPGNIPIKILEARVGTGLNAFITLIEARKRGLEISYVSLEAYPLTEQEYSALNYPGTVPHGGTLADEFLHLHECPWNTTVEICKGFSLEKRHAGFENMSDRECHSIVFYDAFSPRVQPELMDRRSAFPVLPRTGPARSVRNVLRQRQRTPHIVGRRLQHGKAARPAWKTGDVKGNQNHMKPLLNAS